MNRFNFFVIIQQNKLTQTFEKKCESDIKNSNTSCIPVYIIISSLSIIIDSIGMMVMNDDDYNNNNTKAASFFFYA